ncbi:hypothetical protein [Phytohabitans houttuyneae]|nr:hypothetical protein [Phytohabitans houttuyneae]
MASDPHGSDDAAADGDDEWTDADADADLGTFRGVVLNDTGPVRTVSQPPPGPAQPPAGS